MNRFLLVLLLSGVSCLAVGFWWGLSWSKPALDLPSEMQETELKDLVELYNLVEDEYVDPVNMTQVVEAGLAAMASSLNDPYSFTLDNQLKNKQVKLNAGEYAGVGLSFADVAGETRVIMSLVGSPAYEAGIVEGDRLVSVNGKRVETLTKEAFRNEMLAETGEVLTLEIEHDQVVKTHTLEPKTFLFHTVFYNQLEDGLVYVRIIMFAPQTHHEVEELIEQLVEDQVKGIILDLRGNSGGLIEGGEALLQALVSEGLLYTQEFRTRNDQQVWANGSAALADTLVAVLVDRGTASMAELLAAGLQENGRGILIGEQTFGKGTVWRSFELPSGAFVNLTIGRWFTPNGKNIQGVGLKPDIVYEQPWQDNGELLRLAVTEFNKQMGGE